MSILLASIVPIESVDPPAPRARELPNPVPELECQADDGAVRAQSRIHSALSAQAQAAYVCLATTRVFTSSGLGHGSMPSPHADAFRILLPEPGAHGAFAELLESRNPTSQLYGLAGVRLLDPQFFRLAARALGNSEALVWTVSGCMVSERALGEVVSDSRPGSCDIESGCWAEDLAGRE